MIGTGIAVGMILADLVAQSQLQVRPYWTVLCRGVAVRARIRGRLCALNVWREHGDR